MAYSLDDYLPNVTTQDTRKRQQAYNELVPYLQDPSSSLACEEFDKFVDGLASWISSSNFKISLNGLEIVLLLIDRLGDHFKPHVTSVLAVTIDRLGDSKDPVRESAQDVLLKLMHPASSPQFIIDRSGNAFTHKLWRVKEEMLMVLQRALNLYGAKSIKLNTIVATIVKLLEDSNGPVREAAVNTLVEIYRHVGERVRSDLGKKNINSQKMGLLMHRMDEIRNSGQMLAIDDGHDDVDFAKPVGIPKQSKRSVASAPSGSMSRKTSFGTKSSGGAGAVDEDQFYSLYEDVPKVHIFSNREMQEHVNKIKETLSDTNKDWQKRCESLKAIRSLVIAGAMNYDDWSQQLRGLESCVQLSVKDLRSQIVREACITIAYLSTQLSNKLDHFAECVLPPLINQLSNSAKIMATSASTCIQIMLRHTHAPRMIPILLSHLSSKASIIRRVCFEQLTLVLAAWGTHSLEKHIAALQEAIKKGMSDADSEVRAQARKAYWGFNGHFPSQAASLLDSLDSQKQKLLQQGEVSNSSSNSSIGASVSTGATRVKSAGKTRTRSHDRTEMLYGASSSGGARRTLLPSSKTSHTDTTDGRSHSGRSANHIKRSSSAVDLASNGHQGGGGAYGHLQPRASGGAQRLNVRTTGHHGTGGHTSSAYNSLPRPKKYGIGVTSSDTGERSRTRSKIGVSQSQPSSRSSSPSSRYSYITHQHHHTEGGTTPHRRSGIPRSQGASREGSPSRGYGSARKHSSSGLTTGALRMHQKAVGGGGRDMLAQRVLVPSSAAEQALADALHTGGGRKRYDTYESDDNMSETSSVCSERSFSSYSRATEDVQEILNNLSSGSWAERKEGLIQLKILLRNGRTLNMGELRKIQEVFTRMFHDPHGKVFSLFLETLQDLLNVHKLELHDWLYTCLTRLLQKMGADMLGSVQAKVQRALEGVRDSFEYDHQFRCITKFIVDSAQSTNIKVKVKVAVLNYMHGLAALMEPEQLSNTSDTRLSVSRIITWTTEPKSVDVRKAAQAVLIALFNLNTPEFSMLLQALPKTFQEGATKILHNHVRTHSTDHEPLTPRNNPTTRYRPSPHRRHVDDADTENMNPEDINHSFKTLQQDIQSLTIDAHQDDLKKERDTTSQDSGIQQGSMQDVRDNNKESPRIPRQYNPNQYQDNEKNINGFNKSTIQDAVYDVEQEFNYAPVKNLLGYSAYEQPVRNNKFPASDVITEILAELSNHNQREEERKNAMLNLIKLTREGAVDVWDEHFKTILLLLLETLGGDTDGQVRALALRVLREILRNQPTRFKDYAELTILKILEAQRDPEREVARASEECAVTLAHSIAPEHSINVLVPILQTAEYPVSLAAIKMLTKVIENNIQRETLRRLLGSIVPGLLKCYDDAQSPVRKASVFCLVAVYNVVGEELRPHIGTLSGSKLKLLNLYIKRSTTQSSDQDSATTSKTTSPTTSTLTGF